MSITPEKPPRKFPAPCWTQEETLALIDAYRERWYALRRGYLRTADWDAVAVAVAARCPDASPAKTSAQCRHKMEKLRQRYRAERQRAVSFPGRFFSTWFFFDNMDSMENGGSISIVGSNPETSNQAGYPSVFRIKNVGDRNLVESVIKPNKSKKSGRNSNPNFAIDPNLVTVSYREKNSGKIDGNYSPNLGSKILNGSSSNLDDGSDADDVDDTDFGAGFRVRVPFTEKLLNPVLKAKKLGKIHGNFGTNFDGNHGDANGFYDGAGFYDQDLLPPEFRVKNSGKVLGKMNPNFLCADGGFGANVRLKNSVKNDMHADVSNGFSSGYGYGSGKKSVGKGVKRQKGAIDEMVSSIKLLGEGFVKMEKMKMEMAREIEQMRMEMELKRNELILESQRQIVDAFVTVLMENKKKKEADC